MREEKKSWSGSFGRSWSARWGRSEQSQRRFAARLWVSLDLAFSLLLSRLTASCRSCRWEAIAAGTARQQSWKFCFLGDFVLRAWKTLAYLSVEYFDGREVLLVVYWLHSRCFVEKLLFESRVRTRLNGQVENLKKLVSYLVDPASSHMLVSKIKPCMSKYKRLYCETANGSLNQLWFIWW